MRGFIAALVLMGALAASPAFADWTELQGPHFTVLSDRGAGNARDVMAQFEEIRTALQTLWPWTRVDLDRPVVIFAVRSEEAMRSFVPTSSVPLGSFQAEGPDRHYIVIRTDLQSNAANPHRIAFGTYVLTLLNAKSSRELPLWFSTGIAGVMSNIVTAGDSIEVGRPIPAYVQTIRTLRPMPAVELIEVARTSRQFTDATLRKRFDASSWAFVHLLMLGNHAGGLDRYWRTLVEGKSVPDSAFLTSLGKVDDLDEEFATYLQRSTWPVVKVAVTVTTSGGARATRVVPADDMEALRATFLAVTGRADDARAALRKITNTRSKSVAVYEAEGMVADRSGMADAALASYARALAQGSDNFYSHLRWAILARAQPTADLLTVTEAMEHAIALNANYGLAHRALGEVQWARGIRDWALASLQQAVSVEPGETGHRQLLAQMLAALGRQQDADREGAEALAVARTPAEREAAQRVMAAIRRPAPVNAPPPR